MAYCWLSLQCDKAPVHFAKITSDYLYMTFSQDPLIHPPRTFCFKQQQITSQGYRTMVTGKAVGLDAQRVPVSTTENASVCWAGTDSLRARRSGDRVPVGVTFSAPIQTGPGAHPASYTLGTGPFPGVKRLGCGVNQPPHLQPRLKKEYSYTSTPHLDLHGLLKGELYVTFTVSEKRSSKEYLGVGVNTRMRETARGRVRYYVSFTINISNIKLKMMWWVRPCRMHWRDHTHIQMFGQETLGEKTT